MATRRQRDGRNPGARGRRRAPHPDRADPAEAGKAIRPVRRRDRTGTVRTAALAFWDNHKLTGYMATYRYYRAFTPSPDQHVLAHFRRRLDDFLSILEQHMQKNAFAIGERPTVADISMLAYLHYPADETGYDLATRH